MKTRKNYSQNRSLFLYTNFVDESMPKKGNQLPGVKIDFKAWQIWEISGRFSGENLSVGPFAES